MKLRNLLNCNYPNDGTRTLFESILVPEVEKAFKDWKKHASDAKCVLIGGCALGYYIKPRVTTDSDLLFMTANEIPLFVETFKRIRPGAFMHKETNVEIEVLVPESINMPVEIAQAIYDHAKIEDGIRIASPSGLVASKLSRFKLQDQADIQALHELGNIDLSPYPLPQSWIEKYDNLVKAFK